MNRPPPFSMTPTTTLQINGRPVHVTNSGARRLSDVLREDLGLTGTKIGCNAGDCGACTVLLDGEQVCACLVPIGQCEGRAVSTVEGLAAGGERGAGLARLQQAFIDHGAAQCGICTPGMLMAATDTLRRHPQPTEAQVLDGLGGVLCRCTGYRKIVEAVMAAGAAIAPATAGAEPGACGSVCADPAAGTAVGARLPRRDALGKVTGSARFGADEAPADALWLRVIRSPHASANFRYGDLDAFVARAGLHGVVTAADIPNNRFAIFADLRDQPAIAPGVVRMPGEAVLVVAGCQEAVQALDLSLVPIEYEVRPALTDAEQALVPRSEERRVGKEC